MSHTLRISRKQHLRETCKNHDYPNRSCNFGGFRMIFENICIFRELVNSGIREWNLELETCFPFVSSFSGLNCHYFVNFSNFAHAIGFLNEIDVFAKNSKVSRSGPRFRSSGLRFRSSGFRFRIESQDGCKTIPKQLRRKKIDVI